MKNLVFVHGMRQEGKDRDLLRRAWEDALTSAWARLGLAKPHYDLHMPFYGYELERLTQEARRISPDVVPRGADGADIGNAEVALLRAMATDAGVTEAQIDAELATEMVARGPANWEWVQAIARVLEKHVPPLRRVALAFVSQVDAYLTRPHIGRAVDDIVGPSLGMPGAVVVAHSLGTIISYRILRALKTNASVPLFVTLGSPLGISAVKDRLTPPRLAVPDGVHKWLNGTDERDYVALVASLDVTSFATGIENITTIENRRDDAHLILDYLSDESVARRIHSVLS